MRILIKLLKDLLRKNKLNDTCSGGVGSFLLFNLVYAYFLYLKRDQNSDKKKLTYNISYFKKNDSKNFSKADKNSDNFSIRFNKKNQNIDSCDEDSYLILTDDDTNSHLSALNDGFNYNKFSYNDFACKDNLELETNYENDNFKENENQYTEDSIENNDNKNIYDNVGKLFIGFLRFYGFEFDYDKFGISNLDEGRFFLKSENIDMKYSDSMIWVENFTDKTHNISRGTKKFPIVLQYFKRIFYYLKTTEIESSDKKLVEHLANLVY